MSKGKPEHVGDLITPIYRVPEDKPNSWVWWLLAAFIGYWLLS